MITDDQVATLLREAVLTAPLPRPVDLAEVERQGRARRTTSRALGGLGVVAAVVLVVASWRAVGLTDGSLTEPAGSGGPSAGVLAAALLAILAFAFVACGVATVAAVRRPRGAPMRVATGALWGALAALVGGLLPEYFGLYGLDLTRLADVRPLRLAVAIAVLVPPVWIALGLRRRALGRVRGGLPAALWLVLAWSVGVRIGDVTHWVTYEYGLKSQLTTVLLSTTVAYALASACAWPLLRRAGHRRPLLGAIGATGVVVAGVVASRYWGIAFLPLASRYSHVPALLLLAGSILVAVLGARLVVGSLMSSPWRTAGLVALTGLLAASAGDHAASVLLVPVLNPAHAPEMTGCATWAAVLAVATGCCLYVLDRRLDLGRSATSDVAEPRPEG